MNKLIILFTITISLACLATFVSGDCYRTLGCSNPAKNKEFVYGQRWRPADNFCYRCTCYTRKIRITTCQTAVPTPKISGVKKSTFAARLTGNSYNTPVGDEEVEVPEYKAAAIRCQPVSGFSYDPLTGKVTLPQFKLVHYYYLRKESQCCSRFVSYSNVDPECKVVKVSRCKSKLVLKSNPKKNCNKPTFMVG